MLEMITAIALWCSVPTPVAPGRTLNQVQECRERLLKCLTKNEQKCFEQERLK